MKKLLLPILIVVVSLSYYAKSGGALNAPSTPLENNESTNIQNNFQCDGRQHCSQMTSYEEAVYFNENCPNTKMDGDHDGKPCERQFNRY